MKYKGIIALFIVGFAILIYPHLAQYINSHSQKNQVEEFHNHLDELSEEEVNEIMDRAKVCNEEVYYDIDGFRDPFGDNQQKLTEFNECLGFDDNDIFSAIEIPKLKLVIPVYLGSSEDILSKGIGHVEGSSLPLGGESTHTVLAGHRGMGTKAMFRHIDELSPGDIFYIHTVEETLTYKVYDTRIILPHEVESLYIQEEKDLASLFSCHPYPHNSHRLVVYGERIHD